MTINRVRVFPGGEPYTGSSVLLEIVLLFAIGVRCKGFGDGERFRIARDADGGSVAVSFERMPARSPFLAFSLLKKSSTAAKTSWSDASFG